MVTSTQERHDGRAYGETPDGRSVEMDCTIHDGEGVIVIEAAAQDRIVIRHADFQDMVAELHDAGWLLLGAERA